MTKSQNAASERGRFSLVSKDSATIQQAPTRQLLPYRIRDLKHLLFFFFRGPFSTVNTIVWYYYIGTYLPRYLRSFQDSELTANGYFFGLK